MLSFRILLTIIVAIVQIIAGSALSSYCTYADRATFLDHAGRFHCEMPKFLRSEECEAVTYNRIFWTDSYPRGIKAIKTVSCVWYEETEAPSTVPSTVPSAAPSTAPSTAPNPMPSEKPSFIPSDTPSLHPSALLSLEPSSYPSMLPSDMPTFLRGNNNDGAKKRGMSDAFNKFLSLVFSFFVFFLIIKKLTKKYGY